MGMDIIENYVDIMLRLPTMEDTVGDALYV
jgi:hypothetical protein